MMHLHIVPRSTSRRLPLKPIYANHDAKLESPLRITAPREGPGVGDCILAALAS
jgi:hypothetical protein